MPTIARVVRTAAAQIEVALGQPEINVERHIRWIERARADGVELLVFPELSLTGYRLGPHAHELSMHETDPQLRRLAHAAGDMTVVVGFVEEGVAAQIYCSAAVLHDGEVVFVHRKLNLANYGAMEEAKLFAPGRYVETFDTLSPFRSCVLLCADAWNPALVHLAMLHGTTVLIVPTNSSLDMESGDVSKPQKWDLVLGFYATIYGLPIVFANRIGTETGCTFWGGSRILSPRGVVLARAGEDSEELIVADLDYAEVRAARFELPTVRDSNLALIHREVDRLVTRLGVPDTRT